MFDRCIRGRCMWMAKWSQRTLLQNLRFMTWSPLYVPILYSKYRHIIWDLHLGSAHKGLGFRVWCFQKLQLGLKIIENHSKKSLHPVTTLKNPLLEVCVLVSCTVIGFSSTLLKSPQFWSDSQFVPLSSDFLFWKFSGCSLWVLF
jgi:hypothetical protein